MAVKSKDEIMKAIKAKIGDDNSDETIALLEDITDTLNDYDTRTKEDTEWKTKYEENDKEWRKKYTDRFFNNSDDIKDIKDVNGDIDDGDIDDTPEKTSFDELFSTGEE